MKMYMSYFSEGQMFILLTAFLNLPFHPKMHCQLPNE